MHTHDTDNGFLKTVATALVALTLAVGCEGTLPTPTSVPPGEPTARPTASPAPPTATPGGSELKIALVDSGQRLGSARSWDVALGDVDGDGDLDAFVANDVRGEVSSAVWLNDGRGAFADSGQDLGHGMSVALGDVDGDGDLDAFVVSWDEAARVWRNDGTGSFADSGQRLGDPGGWDVALGDVDGDGDLDAFVATDKANTVWSNDGRGAFTDTGQRLGTTYSAGVGLGDLDGDGDLDALTAGWGEPAKLWLNDGAGTFTDSGQALSPGSIHMHGMGLGDADGDGDLDAFLAGAPCQLWLNDGAGAFTQSEQDLRSRAGDTVTFGDLDGDGDLDIYVAVGDRTNSVDKVWLNEGDGRFADSGLHLSNRFSSGIGLGDLDGDGDLDAFVVYGELGKDKGGGLPNEVWLNETPGAAARTTGSDGPGIAFISDRDGNYEIYFAPTAHASTDGNLVRLTNHPAHDNRPYWSPDGTRIAFASRRAGNWDVYVLDVRDILQGAGAGTPQRLTDHPAADYSPVWSPDGTQIAFTSTRDGNHEIYVMPVPGRAGAPGTALRRLTNNAANDWCASWSPDSTQLAIYSDRDGDYELYIAPAPSANASGYIDASNLRQLTHNSTHDYHAMWSPSAGGTRIAFDAIRNGRRDIYVMDLTGGDQRRLTNTFAGNEGPFWSPDGTQIAFASEHDGDGEIYVMDADGGNLRRLTDNHANDYAPSWRP